MELYVLNNDFKVLGIMDNYECLVWERNYYKPGTFSMQIIPDFYQFQLLKKGNILLKKDNTKEAMYIDYRELEENEEGVEVLLVKGCSITKCMDRRITLYKQLEKGNAETVIRNYVDSNCINITEANRKVSNLIQGVNNNLGQEVDYMSHYKPLLEEIESIATTNELGYKVDLDLPNQKYIFEVYQGLDRTVNQEVNSKAIFSSEFENVANQKYIQSDNNYRNMVLVAGAGEDLARKTLTIGEENSSFDRYELFVDARDISDKENKTRIVTDEVTGEEREETYEVDIPIETYNKLLEARGKEKLAECTKIETFDCTLNNINSLRYRDDYDLGDKVSIINKKWGLVLHERITSIEETYDVEGLNIQVNIGNNIPTLIDKIKQTMR
jgi:hypothetical protein